VKEQNVVAERRRHLHHARHAVFPSAIALTVRVARTASRCPSL
jgi:hypothetical protein